MGYRANVRARRDAGPGLVVALALLVLAGCWPQAGAGPGKDNHNPFESRLTIDNVATLAPAWREPGMFDAVVGNRVIGTTARFDPTGRPIELTARSPATGQLAWRHRLGPAGADQTIVSASPVGVDDEVWVGWGTALVEGAVTTCSAGYDRLDVATGGVVGGETGRYPELLVPFGRRVAGTWRVQPDPAACPPHQPLGLGVVDAATGASVWADASLADFVVIAGDRLVTAGGGVLRAWDTTVCESDPACAPVWTTPVGQVLRMAAAGDDLLVGVYEGAETPERLVSLDLAGGAIRGSVDVSGALLSLAVDGATVFVSSEAGLTAFDRASCATGPCTASWTAPVAVPTAANLAVAGGVVYVADGHSVSALSAAGCGAAICSPVVTVPVGGEPATLAVASGRLFAGTGSATVAFAPTGT